MSAESQKINIINSLLKKIKFHKNNIIIYILAIHLIILKSNHT